MSKTPGNIHRLRLGSIARKGAASLVLICFMMLAPVTIVFNAIVTPLTQAESWHMVVQETRLGERSRSLLAHFVVSSALQSGQQADFVGDFSLRSWESVAEILFPVEWVETSYRETIDAFLGWVHSNQSGYPLVELDLIPVKQTLSGPRGALAVLPLMQGFPSCEPGFSQVTLLADQLITCLPPDQDLTFFAGLIARSIVNYLPNQISLQSLAQAGVLPAQIEKNLEQARSGVKTAQAAAILGMRASLLLFCLYAWLRLTDWLAWLRKLALPLYLAGGLTALLIGTWHFSLAWGGRMAGTMLFSQVDVETQAWMLDGLKAFSSMSEKQALGMALLLVSLGAALHLVAIIAGRRSMHHAAITTIESTLPSRGKFRKQFR